MRVMFIGDIVGKAGRKILSDHLPRIREEKSIDLVIANAENVAGGNGITKNMAEGLLKSGIDVITLGDHIWDQRCFEMEIDDLKTVCRPANLPPNNPGRDFVVVEKAGKKVGVFCLLGQTLMKIKAECPFRAANDMLTRLPQRCDYIFLDFHAETTSEKVCMGFHLDGRVSAVIGTHTHIPTADARIFKNGTAFLTDAGMTGPWDSCLGRQVEPILQRFLDGRPRHFLIAEKDPRICACIVEIDDETKKSVSIESFIYPKFGESLPEESADKNPPEVKTPAE